MDKEGAALMHSPYEMEWMAEEKLKEMENRAFRRAPEKTPGVLRGFVFRLIQTFFWRRK